ncbi:hypothetical protein [Parvularcula sp. LCG005]|uniref:hypothetical protein n=1 Tax=Parvularcula sp. LCG005 TaxID=3078805 RepID=UPI002943A1C7|nr:hypothetical protein [Parvularcula sp. LCG005]WOI53309.1 hypothetical protein RUI03_14280 [Parvularcula sp. LCG005]
MKLTELALKTWENLPPDSQDSPQRRIADFLTWQEDAVPTLPPLNITRTSSPLKFWQRTFRVSHMTRQEKPTDIARRAANGLSVVFPTNSHLDILLDHFATNYSLVQPENVDPTDPFGDVAKWTAVQEFIVTTASHPTNNFVVFGHDADPIFILSKME